MNNAMAYLLVFLTVLLMSLTLVNLYLYTGAIRRRKDEHWNAFWKITGMSSQEFNALFEFFIKEKISWRDLERYIVRETEKGDEDNEH